MTEDLQKALDSLSRYLAGRDHSELEIRQKLKRRYEAEVIEQAIQYAKDRDLLLAPEKLAAKATAEFARRRKSHQYIQGQLRKKGLPATNSDSDQELEKMRTLLH